MLDNLLKIKVIHLVMINDFLCYEDEPWCVI